MRRSLRQRASVMRKCSYMRQSYGCHVCSRCQRCTPYELARLFSPDSVELLGPSLQCRQNIQNTQATHQRDLQMRCRTSLRQFWRPVPLTLASANPQLSVEGRRPVEVGQTTPERWWRSATSGCAVLGADCQGTFWTGGWSSCIVRLVMKHRVWELLVLDTMGLFFPAGKPVRENRIQRGSSGESLANGSG